MAWAIVAMLLALMLAISAWGWSRIPAGQLVAIHWGFNGRPNTCAPRGVARLILPAIAVVVALVLAVLARAPGSAATLQGTVVATTAILCAAHAFVVGVAARHGRG